MTMTRHNYDAFYELLPVMLSGEQVPHESEPRWEEMHGKKTQRRYIERMEQRAALAEAGQLATGKEVVIVWSEIGSRPSQRYGGAEEVPEYFRSDSEAAEHFAAAQGIAHSINQLTLGDTPVTVDVASRERIDEALNDGGVAHFIFVGHANKSQLTIDPVYTYNWHEHPRVDHLKLSFGVFGCGSDKGNRYFPRIGSTLVDPEVGILYGVGRDYLEQGQPYLFDQLAELPHALLVGTPLSEQAHSFYDGFVRNSDTASSTAPNPAAA